MKVSAYANDIVCFVCDAYSVEQLLHVLTSFEGVSGVRLNRGKSCAPTLNGFQEPSLRGFNIVCCVTVLGVAFTDEGVSLPTWESLVSHFKQQIEITSNFQLPSIDRAYLMKSIFCRKLWYVS